MPEVRDSLSGQVSVLSHLLTATTGPKLRELGLTTGAFELLSAVRASGKKATQAEIARRLGISPATLSEGLRPLVKRGLLEQVPHSRDGRAKLLRLTETGKAAVSDVLRIVNRAERAMVADVDPQALATTLETLKEVNRRLAKQMQDGGDE